MPLCVQMVPFDIRYVWFGQKTLAGTIVGQHRAWSDVGSLVVMATKRQSESPCSPEFTLFFDKHCLAEGTEGTCLSTSPTKDVTNIPPPVLF